MLVDDEPSILTALTRLLRRNGHTVDTAANGRLALMQLQARAYDLILSDLRMPELDGPALYRALVTLYPQLCQRFIFLTGDSLNPDTQAFSVQHHVLQLFKPYTAADLRRVIRQVLHAIEDYGNDSYHMALQEPTPNNVREAGPRLPHHRQGA